MHAYTCTKHLHLRQDISILSNLEHIGHKQSSKFLEDSETPRLCSFSEVQNRM